MMAQGLPRRSARITRVIAGLPRRATAIARDAHRARSRPDLHLPVVDVAAPALQAGDLAGQCGVLLAALAEFVILLALGVLALGGLLAQRLHALRQ